MKIILAFVTLFFVSIMSGCTIMDGNAIVTGNIRPAIPASKVHLYRVAPKNFEEIGILSSSAGHDFKKSSTLMNEAIQRLKEEAAKIGANGIILTAIDERDTPHTTTSYGSAITTSTDGSLYSSGNTISVERGDAYTRLRGVAVYVSK
ncbi:hypothetical protein [Vibrio neonatus]|uniref:hypothetical protein n=1 Tax=Vibrio neonatus TaxID=278860 RepID=UPI0021C47E0F|nr:hypothetical protein [Vibrio neonatus]